MELDQTVHSADELNDLIRKIGYSVIAVQTTPGLLEIRLQIRACDDAMVMGVTTNCGLRFLGRRNMKVTCFATIMQGTGGWRNTEVRFPGLAGYHLSETQTCWYLGPDSMFGSCFLNREKLLEHPDAAPDTRAYRMLKGTNFCNPDLYRHTAFAEAVDARFKTNTCSGDLYALALGMLETCTEAAPLPVLPDAAVDVVNAIPVIVRQIYEGERINTDSVAEQLHISATTLKKTIKMLTGMTPLAYFNLIRAERVRRFLIDPIERRANQCDDTLMSMAAFVHWDEATARRHIKSLTGLTPKALLV